MTQQPVYPQAYPPPAPPQQFQPQFPGYPPAAPAAPQYPAPGYPPQGQFPGQFPGAPAQPPAQPLANGTLDDYFNQPTTGGGPSISWKGKPEGTTYVGIVARDVTNGDVTQQTNFQTKQPEFYRDGRPKFVMKIPLRVQPTQEFPEGEANFFVRGQARDELVRAMNEAGVSGAPKAGATIQVTLVQRKPSGQGMNPSNVVAIRYVPAQDGQQQAPAAQFTGAPSPAPEAQQYQQPASAQQFQPQGQVPGQVQGQPPAMPAQTVVPGQALPQIPEQNYAPGAQPIPPAQAQAPQQGGFTPPPDFNPEQAALLARLQGQQG